MKLQGTVLAFCVSQSSWLLISLVSTFPIIKHPLVMLGAGSVFIPFFAALFYKLQPPVSEDSKGRIHRRNWFYYMCCLFSWSCTIDMILFFEARGTIKGYMDFYLENGEPYLGSVFGTWINFWDATVHFALYLIIIYKYDNKQDYKSVGLYWFGSMFCGMVCLLIGSMVGSYGSEMHPAVFLNTPYIILPFCALAYLLRLKSKGKNMKQEQVTTGSSWNGIVGITLVLGSVLTIAFGFVRGLAALGSPLPIVNQYVAEYEPYILEPGKFGAMHCLFNLIYCIPLQVVVMWAYFNSDVKWGRDMSMVLSGATAQGTFYYLMAAFSSTTPEEYRIKSNAEIVIVLNLIPVVVSHLLTFCWNSNKSKAIKQS